jgi:hypothetical protein
MKGKVDWQFLLYKNIIEPFLKALFHDEEEKFNRSSD